MCPSGLATKHPAFKLLHTYAYHGCPVDTGPPWTKEQLDAAIAYGAHVSATSPDAIAQLSDALNEKLQLAQVKLVPWMSIQQDPPRQLKISPIAMVPHKS
jgi:hypothetical protein